MSEARDRLIDALAECIVARQGLPNRDRAKAVLAEIEVQGWRLKSPKEAREDADEIERLRKEIERLAVDRAWLKSVEVVDTAAAAEIERLRAQVVSLQSSLDAGPPRPGKKTPNALEKPE